ncbi:MAG: division/cell wall cluster transcriptional repressor MraZ [Actinomycetota bacterium]
MSFTGEFRHTMDAKGRLIVPSRMRDEFIGDIVVLTKWLDQCVAMWSQEGWTELERMLRALPQSDARARTIVRVVAGSASPDEIDRQGRINVPLPLREYAGVDRDVVLVGLFNRAEIWNPERLAEQQAHGEQRMEELVEGLNF